MPAMHSPPSSLLRFKARLNTFLNKTDPAVFLAFFLIGVINNVIYVIILSAALDLVGPDIPKGLVLLADDVPSLMAKLVLPSFIHKVPYWSRVLCLCALSSGGIILVATTPSIASGGSVTGKLFGVVLGSLSTGVGEASFLSMTHFYGQSSLAAWGSGTGGAGLIGAGLYFLFTSVVHLRVKTSLLMSSFLPLVMLVAFFIILPHGPLNGKQTFKGYQGLDQDDDSNEDQDQSGATPDISVVPAVSPHFAEAYAPRSISQSRFRSRNPNLSNNISLAASLVVPYILPITLVYLAEYLINQGVAPTVLFPISETPFTHYRSFYPFYNLLYQIGVLVSRSSIAFMRVRSLYIPSLLQICNLFILISQALYNWIPSVYIVFAVIFWEGLLGGVVYVNTFASILDNVSEEDREFSLGVSSVGTSSGICIAASLGMIIEPRLCDWQVARGRGWCKIYDG